MDRRNFLLTGAALAAIPLTATPDPSGAGMPGQVRLETGNKMTTFGNEYIERIFRNDSWQTFRLRNNRTSNVYEFPNADDVVLEIAEIHDIHELPTQTRKVTLKDFTYGGRELRDKANGGKELAFRGHWEGIDLGVSYELQPNWFYMKKRVEITNRRGNRLFLSVLYLESLRNQLARKHMIDVVRGLMYYKPVNRSDDCFNLMEYPGGMESLFDLQYFPGIFLEPGEHYVSYPAVVGMTTKGEVDFALRQYVYNEIHWYPGAAPHTCAPWLVHVDWDGTPENIYPHLRKSALMGIKLFIVDARLDRYRMEKEGDEKWLEYELPDKTRFPEGIEGFLTETETAGLKIGYYLRTSSLVLRREQWMIDNPKLPASFRVNPQPVSGHYLGAEGGVSCFGCHSYQEYFRNYTMGLVKSYRSGFFHFDWYQTYPCTHDRHDHLANGWDSMDKQHEAFMQSLTAMRKENAGIVLQTGGGCLSVHWMKWLSHSFLHDIQPGPVPDLSYTRSCGALVRERLHNYAKDGFSPMMMYSTWGDPGGDLTKNPFGWKDGFMNAVALAPQVRVKAGLWSYGRKDLEWMKNWLDWRSAHTTGYTNVRFLGGRPFERGTEGYAFVENSEGYLYFVNNEYADHEIKVRLDESIGIFDRKQRYRVALLYPVEATLASDKTPYFHYGQEFSLHLPFKVIRYLAVFPYRGNIPEQKLITRLPIQSDRWVINPPRISSKTSGGLVQYTCSISIPGEEVLAKGLAGEPADTSIHLFNGPVNEDPEDRIYLLLYADTSARDMEVGANPFPGLSVSLNGTPIGGTIKTRNGGYGAHLRELPYFFSDVTELVKPGDNAIQWETGTNAYLIVEAVLVRENYEAFPDFEPSTEGLS